MINEQWKKRKTVRYFDSKVIPSTDKIEKLEHCINFLPIQTSIANNSLPNFLVFKVGPDEYQFKYELLTNVFHTKEKDEYFCCLYDAPYVFIMVELTTIGLLGDVATVEPDNIILHTNLGVTMGALISEAVSNDLSVTTLACTAGSINHDILNKKYNTELQKFREIHKNQKLSLGEVLGAVCVGYEPPTIIPYAHPVTGLSKHKTLNLNYRPYKKLNKNQPFMYIHD
jgi:hypothetical protein